MGTSYSSTSREHDAMEFSRDGRNRERDGVREMNRDRHRDRDRRDDHFRSRYQHSPSPSDRMIRNSDASPGIIGRGRGRGRGAGINVPAWMNDDRLKRQLQEQNVKGSEPRPNDSNRANQGSNGVGQGDLTKEEKKNDNHSKSIEEIDTEMEIKRRQEKDEEELQNLAAQFDDANPRNEEDEVDMLNMFETDEEKEERLARERRERRKRRLREVQPSVEFERASKKQSSGKSRQEGIQEGNPEERAVIQKNSRNDDEAKVLHDETSKSLVTDGNSGIDSFDIFSSNVSPPTAATQKSAATMASGTGLDDAEGYYRATIGEIVSFTSTSIDDETISGSFRVQGIIGKGVFSTVLKCTRISNNGLGQEDVVAIKLIRSNETMAKAAQKEVRILRLLNTDRGHSNKTSKETHIVKMYELDEWDETSKLETHEGHRHAENYQNSALLEYQNHTAIIFEHLPINLRETLSKFGKNVGINIAAVRSFAKQLLIALKHLASHRIVHADIKLDNILVNESFSTVKLCDFGSAFFETDLDLAMTPYLVSRFYRAPEIMLGLTYDGKIDLWSVAVSLAELFTGKVLFPGRTNNDMLKRFMECKGAFSNKMVRRHVVGFTTLGLQPHFETTVQGGSNYNFRQQEFDKVTGKPVIRVVGTNNMIVPSKQIVQVLLRSRSANDSRGDVQKFGDFLFKLLSLDPVKRMGIDDALSHDFITAKKQPQIVDTSS